MKKSSKRDLEPSGVDAFLVFYQVRHVLDSRVAPVDGHLLLVRHQFPQIWGAACMIPMVVGDKSADDFQLKEESEI